MLHCFTQSCYGYPPPPAWCCVVSPEITVVGADVGVQEPGFNRGYWADFEDFVRELVMPDSAVRPANPTALSPPFKNVYVVTGPLFLPSKEPSQGSKAGEL